VPADGSADEAGTLRSLKHPNIAQCLDSGETADGHRYLAMEYVEGRPITEYADQRGLSIHDRLDLFLKTCEAIEYSHDHLVVHLDIKPGNILVNQEGSVKVIDFGIARRLVGREIAEHSSAFSGPYASPEQIQAGSKLGFPADIYSLGAVLYELLCGHEPFDPRLAAGELERQILEDTPRPPSDALSQSKLKQSDAGQHFRLEPETIARMRGGCRLAEARKLIAGDLDRICLFALRKEPARRYRSVDDLRSDLERVLEGRKPAIARSGDPIYSAVRAARRRPLELVGVVAAITAVLTGFAFFGLFSAGINASLENKRQYEWAAESGLRELHEELRPRLTTDRRFRASLDALDTVLRAAAPVRSEKTLFDELRDDLVLQMRRIMGTIPKGDKGDVSGVP
jgi:serine/threonine protein kinase